MLKRHEKTSGKKKEVLVSPLCHLGSHLFWPTSQLKGKLSNLNQYQTHFHPPLRCFHLGRCFVNFHVTPLWGFFVFSFIIELCLKEMCVFSWPDPAMGKTTNIKQRKENNNNQEAYRFSPCGDCGQEAAMDSTSWLKKKEKFSRWLSITTMESGWSWWIKLHIMKRRKQFQKNIVTLSETQLKVEMSVVSNATHSVAAKTSSSHSIARNGVIVAKTPNPKNNNCISQVK